MFPSKKTLDKTINDFNNKASSLIKFQSSPKKTITSPKKEKYKSLKESAKPIYSKARLTMDGNGFRDYQPKTNQKNQQHHLHTRQRQSSLGESDHSSKNSRSSSFEHEESDEGYNIDEQVKNNEPIPFPLECRYNKSSMITQGSIELSLKTDHTPKLNEDYFLIRTYQRGGSCLVRVPFTEEEKEILKRQKEENESLKRQKEEEKNLKRQKEENESLKRQKEEKETLKRQKEEEEILKSQKEEENILNRQNKKEEIIRIQNDKQNQLNTSTYSGQIEINHIQKFNKIIRTDSIVSETDSMKDFTDFCHRRVEMDNINNKDTNNFTNKHRENFQSDSFEDDFDLVHMMDDSGKIVWNSLAEKYDVGPFIWYDHSVLGHKNNQQYNTENVLKSVTVVNPAEIKRQCHVEMMLNNENLDIPEVLEDNNNEYLDNTPSGFRHSVQSPDPRNYTDSFDSDQHQIHRTEIYNDNLV